MRVRDFMTKSVVFCRPDTNLAAAAALMWDKNCGTLPVVGDGEKVTGMITDRDICVALGTRNKLASELRVRDVTSGHTQACHPDDEIHSALKTMREGQVRRLPVVNHAGTLEGILCLDEVVLLAQHWDGAKRPGVSYEDVVNTLRAICRRHTQPKGGWSRAA